MPLPNFLVVGSQKSGTSWLHRSLERSQQIFASEVKELNFFNQTKFDAPEKVAAFRQHFPQEELPGVRYYLESTPHYFKSDLTTARNIRAMLGTPKMVAVFRHPVERYESAYIHHMMKGRFPYAPTIDNITDDYRILSFGRYAETLEGWWTIHPQLKPMLYDDLVRDPVAFVGEVMDYLGLESDLTPGDLAFRANDKQEKKAELGSHWKELPMLTRRVRRLLFEEYDADTRRLQDLLGRDLSGWRRA